MSDPMAILDSSADVVSAMTGVKNQFVNSGWSEASAELMVIEMYRMATAQAQRNSAVES